MNIGRGERQRQKYRENEKEKIEIKKKKKKEISAIQYEGNLNLWDSTDYRRSYKWQLDALPMLFEVRTVRERTYGEIGPIRGRYIQRNKIK